MPPLRRRKVSAGSASIGTLLADESRARAEALSAAHEAERQAAKATSAAFNKAKILFDQFNSGNMSFTDLKNGIAAIKSSNPDSELSAALDSGMESAKATNLQNEINSKTKAYNDGTLSFKDYKQYLEGIKTANTVINANIAKAITDSRTNENTRVMNNAYGDYLNGKIDIKQYQTILGDLRNQPGQSATNLSDISKAIDAARVTEGEMNDAKTYAGWQTGTITAADAMAYFQARIANAKTPQEAQTAADALGKIKASNDANAKGAASHYAAMIDENANKSLAAFKKDVLEPGVVRCDGDTQCVVDLYKQYGALAQAWSEKGGNLASSMHLESLNAEIAGKQAAANALMTKLTGDFKTALKAAQDDKNASPESRAAMIAAASQALLAGEHNSVLSVAQQKELKDLRTSGVVQIQQIASQGLAEAAAAKDKATAGAQRIFDDVQGAISQGRLDSKDVAALGITVTVTNGKSIVDQKSFMDWLNADPARNAQKAYDLGNAKKNAADSDAASKAAVDAFVTDVKTSNTSQTKVFISLYTTQFPDMRIEQIKAAALESATTGHIIANSNEMNGVVTRLSADDRENARLHNASLQSPPIGNFRLSTDPVTGNVVVNRSTPGDNAIDLGAVSGPPTMVNMEQARSDVARQSANDEAANIRNAEVNPTLGPDAITRAGGDNIRKPGPNDYDYSGPTPVLKNPGMFGPNPVDATTPGPTVAGRGERANSGLIPSFAHAPATAVATDANIPSFDTNFKFNFGGPTVATDNAPSWKPTEFTSILGPDQSGAGSGSGNLGGNGTNALSD